ncbi:CIA30 family protein [Rhodovulum euryhalinum]|uniref:Complex I intermediate-associated protein 30 (CIA30) n=1 Tax=Rhodovulum euryhalinum TaxID=35805 RepID=A0A4R2KFX7_9RHOB|nr:CIA30 family protein [Rhodovulum euryhalinum]TCO71157.1 complex I intermediate-associated protein 30 (CIA30) [Rhodovulum euryhalinum]
MSRLAAALILALAGPAMAENMIEPVTAESARAWSFLSDRVMGGVSTGAAAYAEEDGVGYLRLSGAVSTANRGGFIQMRRGVTGPPGAEGIALRVRGDGQRYFVHLRLRGVQRPWQFFQAPFETSTTWRDIRIPFTAFRLQGGAQDVSLLPERLESLGIAAYGRDHQADVSLSGLGFYPG